MDLAKPCLYTLVCNLRSSSFCVVSCRTLSSSSSSSASNPYRLIRRRSAAPSNTRLGSSGSRVSKVRAAFRSFASAYWTRQISLLQRSPYSPTSFSSASRRSFSKGRRGVLNVLRSALVTRQRSKEEERGREKEIRGFKNKLSFSRFAAESRRRGCSGFNLIGHYLSSDTIWTRFSKYNPWYDVTFLFETRTRATILTGESDHDDVFYVLLLRYFLLLTVAVHSVSRHGCCCCLFYY